MYQRSRSIRGRYLAGTTVIAVLALSALAVLRAGPAIRQIQRLQTRLRDLRLNRPPGSDGTVADNGALDRLDRSLDRQRRLASDASHELRTPIAGIRANLEDMLVHPDHIEVTALQAALRDTQRLEAIVSDLLLLTRLDAGQLTREPIDLAALISQQLALRTTALTVHAELDHQTWVGGVPERLARLVSNLLDNAERHADTAIEVVLSASSGQAIMTITNDGPGIGRQDRERIFDRFTRLDTARSRTTGGAGLGLAIARDIAEAHQGTLNAEPSSQGAKFALRLPLIDS